MKSKQARFIDYPEGEYTQASGNGEYRSVWYAGKDIVRTAWGHADAYNVNSIAKAGKVLRTLLNRSDYQHYLKDVVLRIKRSQKPYIIMAHEDTVIDEGTGIISRKAPFQGGFAKIGLEASFTTIIGCTSIRPSTLDKKFHNSLLNITPEEKEEDHKYVFQTRRTAGTMGVKYRAPAGMWKPEELYIDNDVVLVMQRITEFYGK